MNCEDWRSRDHLWDLTGYAIELLRRFYPFAEMTHHDELTSAEDDYCLAIPGEYYAIYLPNGGTTNLDLGDNSSTFMLRWYNPRAGGSLQEGSVGEVTGPGSVAIGHPPKDPDKDWVAALRLMPKPRRAK